MKRRLYITALLTSPIIAIYGVSPFYIFGKLVFLDLLRMSGGLTLNILVCWALHIYFALNYPHLTNIKRFFYTYILNVIIWGSFVILIRPHDIIKAPTVQDSYLAYPLMTSLAVNIIVLIISNSIMLGQKQLMANKEIQELKLQNSEAQKQVLMQQLQPHFLFNSLSVLKSLITENQQQATDYAVKLSEFLRYSVQSHHKELVSLAEELQFTNDYLALQKVRFENSFSCEINIPTHAYTSQIPVYALQTLVENAFKHNYFTEKKPLHIRITHAGEGLEVRNNIVSVKLAERTQTGLKNLNNRYQLIVGKPIDIQETNEEFTVTIPLI